MHVSKPAWWAVALSESVGATQALAVVCDGQQIALFRNPVGTVFALEDRCPHRRVLLSPGVVKGGGLQCPYHGWTFDGASGVCTDIPNLRRDEPIPPKYQALAYPVIERHGFVHVWTGQGVPAFRVPADEVGSPCSPGSPGSDSLRGAAVVSIARDEYIAALLDGPQCLLGFAGVEITDALLGDVRIDGAHAQLDRGALWKGKGARSAFVRDHPLIVRTRVALNGSAARVDLLDADEQPLTTLFMGLNVNLRGTTGLCWRAHVHPDASMPWRVRLPRLVGAAPVSVLARPDGAAIAALQRAGSWDLARIIQRSAA
jgi:nitrite reductase/ring-hydroxylating ferredoxin subunit